MPAATMEKEYVKVIGANGQISLGKKYAGHQVVVQEWEPGVWHVRTAKVIPDNEAWLDNEEVKKILIKMRRMHSGYTYRRNALVS